MQIWDKISADTKQPLSAEEFKLVYETWLCNLVDATDENIASMLPVVTQEEYDTAIRLVKFAAYKRIYWDKLEHYDSDP